jgi:ribosomal protein S18 acetylase RimI-like enzyme
MIRIGSKEDSYAIASLMLLAMEGLVKKFRGTEERLELIALLERFIKFPGNQYSYDNVIVDVTEERIAGVLIAYDGGAIEALRQPFFDFIIENYHPNGFAMDLESEVGEFYFDVLCVDPNYQNRGIGKKLIQAGIEKAKMLGHQKVGLLVDVENINAKRLYESLGFRKVDQRFLLGSTLDHLVLAL